MATVDELHERARDATANADHVTAAALWLAAAEFAYTPEGAEMLRRLSKEAATRAELQQRRNGGG